MADTPADASKEATRRVFEDWFAAWSAHDVEKLVALFAEDCTWEDIPNGVYRGRQEVEALARNTYKMVPDLHLEIRDRWIGEGWFIAEWQATGTNAGDVPGIRASGNRFRMRGASVLVLRDDKIHRYSSYWDTRSMTDKPLAE
jgi:steroid delta-isomerase-like uncharacterized protein